MHKFFILPLCLLIILSACEPLPKVPATSPQPSPQSGGGVTPSPSRSTLAATSPTSPQPSPRSGEGVSSSPFPSGEGRGEVTATLPQTPSSTALPSATLDSRLPPEQWQDWPVVPSVSPRARAIYQKALAAGSDPHRFSKVGDCQNIISFFLAAFDHPGEYILGDKYSGLQPVIDYFAGSWGRESQAVRGGFNVAAVLTAFDADPKACNPSETPLACELRLFKPSLALVSMETWWAGKKADDYEKYLRQIVDYAISHNVLPILATKADNMEGDNSINLAIARVAYDYDLPLWNWWRAAQALPDYGLTADHFHLTHDPDSAADPLLYRRLSDPLAQTFAWPMRNITALQVLDAVRKGLQ